MQVYLCEKPKQGEEIALFLGMSLSDKKKGYYESGKVVVTWALGHLFKLQPPEFYCPEVKKKWDYKCLPIIPEEYEYVLGSKSKVQFRTIKNLLKKAKEVFITTDPDPEGESIARNIIKFAGYKGSVKRILFGSTDDETLKQAFSNPLSINDTQWMYDTAIARARSDWVVGMNLTMAFTLLVQKLEGGSRMKKAFAIGRVKTPVSMLVYHREQAIKNFKPTSYFDVTANLYDSLGNEFVCAWDIPEKHLDSEGRLLSEEFATKAADYICETKLGVIESFNEVVKEKQPPLPYELNSLQVECEKFDISPDETLEIAQSLYDKPFSAITYPRTDTGYLTTGFSEKIDGILSSLFTLDLDEKLKENINPALRSKAWNDKKVKVHHGIVPTSNKIDFSHFSPKQKIVFLLIAKRFLLQFTPNYVFKHTDLKIKIGNLKFKASCNVPVSLGWKAFVSDDDESIVNLPSLKIGQKVGVKSSNTLTKKTRKPNRYTQASLLMAMINISNEVSDPSLKKLLSDQDGIGTVATRSTIIKDLLGNGLLNLKGKYISPSDWLEKHMRHIPEQMKQPANSALWERGFQAIQAGDITSDKFVEFQEKFVKDAVINLNKIYLEVK